MSRHSWIEVSAEYEGKIISGAYRVDENAVTVRTALGRKRAPLSGLTPFTPGKNSFAQIRP